MASSFNFNIHKPLDPRAQLVFQRVRNFFPQFTLLASIISGLSVGCLQFSEFHPTETAVLYASEAFLITSAMAAVVAAMLSVMLLFRFEGHEAPTKLEMIVAWTPLVLLDWSIVEFLIGIMLWYSGKIGMRSWRVALVAGQLGFLLGGAVWMAAWMWSVMRREGGLGSQERSLFGEKNLGNGCVSQPEYSDVQLLHGSAPGHETNNYDASPPHQKPTSTSTRSAPPPGGLSPFSSVLG